MTYDKIKSQFQRSLLTSRDQHSGFLKKLPPYTQEGIRSHDLGITLPQDHAARANAQSHLTQARKKVCGNKFQSFRVGLTGCLANHSFLHFVFSEKKAGFILHDRLFCRSKMPFTVRHKNLCRNLFLFVHSLENQNICSRPPNAS
jgi:hypothetical protein